MKPYKFVIFILLLLSAYGCSKKNNKVDNVEFSFLPAYNRIEVNNDFIVLIDKFIDESSTNASIFLMIVDKSLDNTVLTLIANNYSSDYLKQYNPLFYFIRKDRKVYVVNGFESFFKPEYDKFSPLRNEKYYRIVSYVFNKDSILTYKQGIIPFATPPVSLDSIK